MKKSLVLFLAAGLAAAAFAGKDNVVITFSSTGPDKYADGTTVLDGECYALVWTPDGATFGGIAADGSVLGGGKIVIAAPIAKNGKCPRVQYQVEETYRDANFPGGSFGVYLLDTRKITVVGGVTNIVLQGVAADGTPKLVASYGAVGGATVSSQVASVNATAGVSTTQTSAVPDGAAAPSVKSIAVIGGNVYVTVVNVLPCLKYGLDSGEKPDALAPDAAAGESYGDDPSGEMIFVTPKSADGAGFFRVNRK